jgi:competence CoiA-like predicted nuclease
MFIAKVLETEDRLDATLFQSSSEIRKQYPPGSIVCPDCGSTVFARGSSKRLTHFFHQRKCTSTINKHAESADHLLGKKALYKKMIGDFAKEGIDVAVFYEYRLPECGENGRIADVLGLLPCGYKIIYECQLSPITPEKLEERTLDYASIGADVIWYLGKSADSYENREWCIDHQGESFSLDYKTISQGAECLHQEYGQEVAREDFGTTQMDEQKLA